MMMTKPVNATFDAVRHLPGGALAPALSGDVALGPAIVQTVSADAQDGRVDVAGGILGEDRIAARLALPLPYTPAKGDHVLLIRQRDDAYVIGVLHTAGAMRLTFPGDVHLSAPLGSIHLDAGKRVEIGAPTVAVRAGVVSTTAREIRQRCSQLYRWVAGAMHLRAGRRHDVVEGMDYRRADRHVIKAHRDVRVDGKRINLG